MKNQVKFKSLLSQSLSPERIFILGFAGVILLGTLLLWFPFSATKHPLLRKKHHIGVIAIRDVLTDQVQMIPSADFMIKDSDILVVIGKEEDIRKLT